MSRYPEPLTQLIQTFGQLPGVGPRSAERMALVVLDWPRDRVTQFSNLIQSTTERIGICATCGCFQVDEICENCEKIESLSGTETEGSLILCVVEKPTDIFSLERFKSFDGAFHALGGTISPSSGVEPEDLYIGSLLKTISTHKPREIIFALTSDLESEATIHFIKEQIANLGMDPSPELSRLAQGLPAGSSLEFTDGVTLTQALENRKRLDQ